MKCKTCEKDRITVNAAFRIANDEQDACRSCRELAWLVVAGELDRQERAGFDFSAEVTVTHERFDPLKL